MMNQQMAKLAEALTRLDKAKAPLTVDLGTPEPGGSRNLGDGLLLSPTAGAQGPLSTPRPQDPGTAATTLGVEAARMRGRPPDEHLGDGRMVTPKMNFPKFNGTFPRLWRDNCIDYFQACNITPAMWLTTARMNLEGNAAHWFQAYKLRNEVLSWQQFITAVEAKFGVDDHRHSSCRHCLR